MSKDTIIAAPDVRSLAESLKELYYLYIGHIDLDLVFFGERMSATPPKESAKPKPSVKIEKISPASRQLLEQVGQGFQLILTVDSDRWSQLGPSTQQWELFDALLLIDPAGDGKLRGRDVQEWGFIIGYFNDPYWRKKVGTEPLPDMLANGALPIPLPPDDSPDEGSTLADL